MATSIAAAAKGEEVVLKDLGAFNLKEGPARERGNLGIPATIQIAVSRNMRFAPGAAANDKLNGQVIGERDQTGRRLRSGR